MKIKNLSEEQKTIIYSTVEAEGFWYSVTCGGYINPEEILDDPKDIKKVRNAIKVVKEFENSLPSF